MKHEQVVQQLLSKLRITSFSPEYPILKEIALILVEAECGNREIKELPDTEVDEFINKTKSIDLYGRYIEETQYKMRVARVCAPEIDFSLGESILFDAAIKNLSYYLERMAAILLLDNVDFFVEEDLKRLGVENHHD